MMNRFAKFFNRPPLKSTPDQSSHTLFVECLEERQMLSTVDIIAAGATGEETIELIIEGETVAVFENVGGDFDNREFVTLSYNTDEVINAEGFEVAFTNDLFDPENGIDRNVLIDAVLIDFESDGSVDEGEVVPPFPPIFRFETESPNVFSTGTFRPEDGIVRGQGRGEVLHANGAFQFSGPSARAGATFVGRDNIIDINARGDTGDEQFNLLIDGEVVQTYNVTTELAEYRYVAEASVSPERIRVEFINDLFDPDNGIDRNLIVSSIRTDTDQLLQTEAATTFSTGVFRAGEGIVSGFNETETLSTNGFFEYLVRSDSVRFAQDDYFTSNDRSQVFVSDDVLTVRGTPDSVASASRTLQVEGDGTYNFSFDAYRDIISGSINASNGQPFGSIGINFNDANGNVASQRIFNITALDSQSDGFRSFDLRSPEDAVSATIFVFAGQTTPGVEIPVRVRDIQIEFVPDADVTPPSLRLLTTPNTREDTSLRFSVEVTDESGLQLVDPTFPGLTVVGPNGYRADLEVGEPSFEGGNFIYTLFPQFGDEFTNADNGEYFVTVNAGAYSDSLGNLVEEQQIGSVLVLIPFA